MLPNATRLANSAIAATIAVFDRLMIRISTLLRARRLRLRLQSPG
jgi:hypothetical protein